MGNSQTENIFTETAIIRETMGDLSLMEMVSAHHWGDKIDSE